jgi:hypothetical protein
MLNLLGSLDDINFMQLSGDLERAAVSDPSFTFSLLRFSPYPALGTATW